MGSSELPLLVHGEGKGLPQPVLAGGNRGFALLLKPGPRQSRRSRSPLQHSSAKCKELLNEPATMSS